MKLKLCEILSDVIHMDIEATKQILDDKKSIKNYAYILHDKDVNEDGTPKNPHYHIMLRLIDSYDTKYIAGWFGVAENFVGKVKSRWADALAYLTHENSPEKYQYDEDEVISDYDWKKDKIKALGEARRLEIIHMIYSGEIKPYNKNDYILPEEYDKYKRSIDNTFNFRAELLRREVNREMKAIYIKGDSGCGKSTWAKQYAQKQGMKVFVSSGSNDVLDGYEGEECIILDDLRPSCMGLSDLLKMLDNHTASTVKSRYHNKILECKLIVITSVLPIDEFFKNVFESEREPITQFKRRCSVYVEMNTNFIDVSFYDDYKRDYTNTQRIPNTVLKGIKLKSITNDQAKQMTMEMFGVEPIPPMEKPEIPDFNHMDESDPRYYEAFL